MRLGEGWETTPYSEFQSSARGKGRVCASIRQKLGIWMRDGQAPGRFRDRWSETQGWIGQTTVMG